MGHVLLLILAPLKMCFVLLTPSIKEEKMAE